MNNDKHKSNHRSNTFHEEPVSRFWACFFAPSIFALIWTLKLKKTRTWLILIIGINIGVFVLITALTGAGNLTPTGEEYDKKYLDQELIYFEEQSPHVLILAIIYYFLYPIIFIVFMFKWTTAYNLATCGYKSKHEWKKSH